MNSYNYLSNTNSFYIAFHKLIDKWPIFGYMT